MRPSECPVVERRVDIPITKCKELELLKSCVEHTAVVIINRLHQDPNDAAHLERQQEWLQSLPVSSAPVSPKSPLKKQQTQAQNSSHIQLQKQTNGHLQKHSPAKADKDLQMQLHMLSYPQLEQEPEVQVRKLPEQLSVKPTEVNLNDNCRLRFEKHQIQLEKLSHQLVQNVPQPRQERNSEKRQGQHQHTVNVVSQPRVEIEKMPQLVQNLTKVQAEKQSGVNLELRRRVQLVSKPYEQREKLPQHLEHTRNELHPGKRPREHVDQSQMECDKIPLNVSEHLEVVHREKRLRLHPEVSNLQPETSTRRKAQEHLEKFPNQQSSLHVSKQPQVHLERLQCQQPEMHLGNQHQLNVQKLNQQLDINLAKHPQVNLEKQTLSHVNEAHHSNVHLGKQPQVHVEKMPPQTDILRSILQRPSTAREPHAVAELEPVKTRLRKHLQLQVDARQQWSQPRFQPRVLVKRLSPEHLARTLHARVVLRRLGAGILRKYGYRLPRERKAKKLQRRAIELDDEDWFDLNRQEWTLCFILQRREKKVAAKWKAVCIPRQPKKKTMRINGLPKRTNTLNKIGFLSKLGLKRRLT